MPVGTSDLTVVLLAGGEATRLPRKLERTDHGDPLIVQAYERFAPHFPVVISASAAFAPEVDARLACPIAIDRWTKRGPLAGLLSALAVVDTTLAFVVAADMPNVGAEVARELLAVYLALDDAVVPEHRYGVEPLCALYDRAAVLRVAPPILRTSGAVRDVLAGMNVRYVGMEPERFANVNTPDDWNREFKGRAAGPDIRTDGVPDGTADR